MTESDPLALRITKSARKDLADLQPKFFKQVMTKILLLAEDSRRCCSFLRNEMGQLRTQVAGNACSRSIS